MVTDVATDAISLLTGSVRLAWLAHFEDPGRLTVHADVPLPIPIPMRLVWSGAALEPCVVHAEAVSAILLRTYRPWG